MNGPKVHNQEFYLICFLGEQNGPPGRDAHKEPEGAESGHGHAPLGQLAQPEEGLKLVNIMDKSPSEVEYNSSYHCRFLDLYGEDMAAFKTHLKKYKVRGLKVDYKSINQYLD